MNKMIVNIAMVLIIVACSSHRQVNQYEVNNTILQISSDRLKFSLGGIDDGKFALPVYGRIEKRGDGLALINESMEFDKVEMGQEVGLIKNISEVDLTIVADGEIIIMKARRQIIVPNAKDNN